jgi:hypothetical protein
MEGKTSLLPVFLSKKAAEIAGKNVCGEAGSEFFLLEFSYYIVTGGE